jgi:hypothetical protein
MYTLSFIPRAPCLRKKSLRLHLYLANYVQTQHFNFVAGKAKDCEVCEQQMSKTLTPPGAKFGGSGKI